MSDYQLDRSAFKAQTVEEAANHFTYYRKLSWHEWVKIAAYLNSVAYQYDLDNPPRLDKTCFAAKSSVNL